MPGRADLEDDGLRLPDQDQASALWHAVFRSGRATGLGPHRAAMVATHTTEHIVGQLRAYGYQLRIEWVSEPARTALQAARSPRSGPPLEPVETPEIGLEDLDAALEAEWTGSVDHRALRPR